MSITSLQRPKMMKKGSSFGTSMSFFGIGGSEYESDDENDEPVQFTEKRGIASTMSNIFTESFMNNLYRWCTLVVQRWLKSGSFMLLIFAVINLFLFSDRDGELYQHKTGDWYAFYFSLLMVHGFTTALSETTFFLTDKLFRHHYGTALMLRILHGPAPSLATIIVINVWLGREGVLSSLPNWNILHSALIAIFILQISKNFIQRSHYVRMLETRFGERYARLQTQVLILSRLATYIHPPVAAAIKQERAMQKQQSWGKREAPKDYLHADLQFDVATRVSLIMEEQQKQQQQKFDKNNRRRQQEQILDSPIKLEDRIRKHTSSRDSSNESETVPKTNCKQLFPQKSTASILSSVSESTSPTRGIEPDDNSQRAAALQTLRNNKLFRQQLQVNRTAAEIEKLKTIFQNIEVHDAPDEQIHHAILLAQHENFWRDVASLVKKRPMKVETFNGILTLSSKSIAHGFAENLYRHLSRNRSEPIDFQKIENILRDESIVPQELENIEHTVKMAKDLFLGNRKNYTAEDISGVVLSAYEQRRNLLKSIDDFKDLRLSLETVSNVIFWVIMILILLSLLQIDFTVLLAPLLTITFGVSFALGPAMSNFLLSVSFVLLVLPFDVGDRVSFVVESGKVTGNVESVNLLYSVILTEYGERLQIPNYLLFNKSIYNLETSRNAKLQIPVAFAMIGKDAPGLDKIHKFCEKLNRYCVEEAKDDWKKAPFYALRGVDSESNALRYSIWLLSTHSFGQVAKLFGARTALIEKMYAIQLEVGIRFMSVSQPIEVTSIPGSVADGISYHSGDNVRGETVGVKNVRENDFRKYNLHGINAPNSHYHTTTPSGNAAED